VCYLTRTTHLLTTAAHLFVAVLGASSYTYAEARWSETLPDWVGAHVNTLDFLGGVPRATVPDYVSGHIIHLMCRSRLCGRAA
jgi:transposase